jgi:hypothetical protein
MNADGFVDLLMQLPASLKIVRREPATYTFGLEISIQPVGEFLVLCRVTDETGVELGLNAARSC